MGRFTRWSAWVAFALLIGCGTGQVQGGDDIGSEPDGKIDIRGVVRELEHDEQNNSEAEQDEGSDRDPDDPISSDDPVTPTPVKDVIGHILVEGEMEADTVHDKANITVKKQTVIEKQLGHDTVPAAFNDVKTGSTVEVTFTGPVEESYPVGAIAGKIVIIEGD